jgi:ankyrin repeat protein
MSRGASAASHSQTDDLFRAAALGDIQTMERLVKTGSNGHPVAPVLCCAVLIALDKKGFTAFHHAALGGHVHAMEWLVHHIQNETMMDAYMRNHPTWMVYAKDAERSVKRLSVLKKVVAHSLDQAKIQLHQPENSGIQKAQQLVGSVLEKLPRYSEAMALQTKINECLAAKDFSICVPSSEIAASNTLASRQAPEAKKEPGTLPAQGATENGLINQDTQLECLDASGSEADSSGTGTLPNAPTEDAPTEDSGQDVGVADDERQKRKSAALRMLSLHNAAEKGNIEAMAWFLNEGGTDVKEADKHGNTALNYAALGGQVEAMEWLMSKGATIKKTHKIGAAAVHLAAHGGRIVSLEWLFAHGADVNEQDTNGATALHYAAQGGKGLAVMDWLVANGADVRAVDQNGTTALHSAAQRGNLAALDWLVGKGVKATTKDGVDATGLHYAASGAMIHAMEWLVDNGVDVQATDRHGATALDNAARGGKVKSMQWLLAHGTDLHAKRDDQGTPLHSAALQGHVDAMQWLLDQGLELGAAKRSGFTALHLAAQGGKMEAMEWLVERITDSATLEAFLTLHNLSNYPPEAQRSINELSVLVRVIKTNLLNARKLCKQWAAENRTELLTKARRLVASVRENLPRYKEALELDAELKQCMQIAADEAMAKLLADEGNGKKAAKAKKKKAKKKSKKKGKKARSSDDELEDLLEGLDAGASTVHVMDDGCEAGGITTIVTRRHRRRRQDSSAHVQAPPSASVSSISWSRQFYEDCDSDGDGDGSGDSGGSEHSSGGVGAREFEAVPVLDRVGRDATTSRVIDSDDEEEEDGCEENEEENEGENEGVNSAHPTEDNLYETALDDLYGSTNDQALDYLYGSSASTVGALDGFYGSNAGLTGVDSLDLGSLAIDDNDGDDDADADDAEDDADNDCNGSSSSNSEERESVATGSGMVRDQQHASSSSASDGLTINPDGGGYYTAKKYDDTSSTHEDEKHKINHSPTSNNASDSSTDSSSTGTFSFAFSPPLDSMAVLQQPPEEGWKFLPPSAAGASGDSRTSSNSTSHLGLPAAPTTSTFNFDTSSTAPESTTAPPPVVFGTGTASFGTGTSFLGTSSFGSNVSFSPNFGGGGTAVPFSPNFGDSKLFSPTGSFSDAKPATFRPNFASGFAMSAGKGSADSKKTRKTDKKSTDKKADLKKKLKSQKKAAAAAAYSAGSAPQIKPVVPFLPGVQNVTNDTFKPFSFSGVHGGIGAPLFHPSVPVLPCSQPAHPPLPGSLGRPQCVADGMGSGMALASPPHDDGINLMLQQAVAHASASGDGMGLEKAIASAKAAAAERGCSVYKFKAFKHAKKKIKQVRRTDSRTHPR